MDFKRVFRGDRMKMSAAHLLLREQAQPDGLDSVVLRAGMRSAW
jgi:hypothetical protein